MQAVGGGSDRESLLAHRVKRVEDANRRLRLALRTAIPHTPEDTRTYLMRVMEETRDAVP